MDNNEKTSPFHNSIDRKLQFAYYFDDEQLEKEMDEAKKSPDLSSDLKPPPDEFQQIMNQIQARRIRPAVLESEPGAKRRKIWRMKKIVKVFLVAAILGTLTLAFGMNVVGKRAFIFRPNDREAERKNVAWNNVEAVTIAGNAQEVYARIKNELKIDVLAMNYIPEDMIFDRLEIKQGVATIKYTYHGNQFYLREMNFEVANSTTFLSDRVIFKEVYNVWIDQNIVINRKEIESGKVEYSMCLNMNNAYYELCGIAEEDIFTAIVEGLGYYNE